MPRAEAAPSPEVAQALDDAADEFGLPRDLLRAVAWVESRYDPHAVSPVGAAGLMQLMPGTADALGVEDPFDPRQSARGGARYLARLIDKYGGDVRRALAAYNWGPGNVDRHERWPRSVHAYADHVLARVATPLGTPVSYFLARLVRPYPWSLA